MIGTREVAPRASWSHTKARLREQGSRVADGYVDYVSSVMLAPAAAVVRCFAHSGSHSRAQPISFSASPKFGPSLVDKPRRQDWIDGVAL